MNEKDQTRKWKKLAKVPGHTSEEKKQLLAERPPLSDEAKELQLSQVNSALGDLDRAYRTMQGFALDFKSSLGMIHVFSSLTLAERGLREYKEDYLVR